MEAPYEDSSSSSELTPGGAAVLALQRRYQKFLDDSSPHTAARWGAFITFFILFFLRIIFAQGWYIVAYAFMIYLLNLFIAFLSPRFEPAFEDSEGDEPGLPTKADEEFKPFVRRLPEFKFWVSAMKAVLVSLFCTMFTVFDVPVFWPILVVYFIILFTITMKRQIRHMIKYRYLPFTTGKKSYGKQDHSRVVAH